MGVLVARVPLLLLDALEEPARKVRARAGLHAIEQQFGANFHLLLRLHEREQFLYRRIVENDS